MTHPTQGCIPTSGDRRRGGHLPALVTATLAAILLVAEVSSASAQQVGGDIVHFLLGRDLVVEGYVTDIQPVTRAPAGGCSNGQSPALHVYDYRIQVAHVLSGTAEDSTIVVTSLEGPRFPRNSFQVGSHALVYANRVCEDGWRLWGGFLVITPSGYLVPPSSQAHTFKLAGVSSKVPLSYSSVTDGLAQTPTSASAAAFGGSDGVAIVRLGTFADDREHGGYAYACDSLGWAIPISAHVPRTLKFLRIPGCLPYLATGDTLVIPVKAGNQSDILDIPACPRAFVVHFGFLGGLGVPLGFLDYALRPHPSGITVNSFIERGTTE
jgi:hypothetical protein